MVQWFKDPGTATAAAQVTVVEWVHRCDQKKKKKTKKPLCFISKMEIILILVYRILLET